MKVGIVSQSQKMTSAIRDQLLGLEKMEIQIHSDPIRLRQQIAHRDEVIFWLNYPLEPEKNLNLAFDLRKYCSAVIVALLPPPIYRQMADGLMRQGIIPVSKPISVTQLKHLAEMSIAQSYQIQVLQQQTQQLQHRIVDLRYQDRAKCLLIEKRHMTEQEAHHYIEQRAMNERKTKREITLDLIERLESEA